MRQPRGFRKSAEREGEDVIAHERRRCIAERERVEDFVGNDRQAEARDRILFGRADVGAGGIIRVDDEYGARALGYYLSDAAGVGSYGDRAARDMTSASSSSGYCSAALVGLEFVRSRRAPRYSLRASVRRLTDAFHCARCENINVERIAFVGRITAPAPEARL